MKEAARKAALASFEIEAKAITDIPGYMDMEAFDKAVEAICKTNKIITCASGSSGIAAKKFSHSLNCVERPCAYMYPSEAVHGGLGIVQKDDVVIMVSRGGKTGELLPIIDVVKKKGAILIGVTENMTAPLAQASDIIIPMRIERESDKYNYMATSSYVATIAIFDAMLCAIMEETGYTREHFGLIHPGGAVGSMLNRKDI